MATKLQAKNWKTLVKFRLLNADLTVTELARRINYPRNSVSIAINNEGRLPGVKKAINFYLNTNGCI